MMPVLPWHAAVLVSAGFCLSCFGEHVALSDNDRDCSGFADRASTLSRSVDFNRNPKGDCILAAPFYFFFSHH